MRIAIIGGGQLARMLALAGLRHGFKFSFLVDKDASNETRCIRGLGEIVVYDPDQSAQTLYERLGCPDIVTIEKEQLDIGLLQALNRYCPVHPNPVACASCSDRLQEKRLLGKLQIPHANFRFLNRASDALQQLQDLKLPLFAKSTRFAYDGRNQFLLRNRAELIDFANAGHGGSWIVEEAIDFDREVSVIGVRCQDGEVTLYPITENTHHQGMLVYSISPAPRISLQQKTAIEQYAKSIMSALDYVGVLAIEFFLHGQQVIVNELAPRVHNSGHWTINGGTSCQFENHLRAVTGMQAGSTSSGEVSGMLNLVGLNKPPVHLLTANSYLHWYDKLPRPGRKVGHVNFRNSSLKKLKKEMTCFASQIGSPIYPDADFTTQKICREA